MNSNIVLAVYPHTINSPSAFLFPELNESSRAPTNFTAVVGYSTAHRINVIASKNNFQSDLPNFNIRPMVLIFS